MNFGGVSNIRLEIQQTIIVPLWKGSLEDAKQVLWAFILEWTNVTTQDHATYLSLTVGPKPSSYIWQCATKKYVERVELAKWSGNGLVSSVLEHKIM